jgi:hypothetical protein
MERAGTLVAVSLKSCLNTFLILDANQVHGSGEEKKQLIIIHTMTKDGLLQFNPSRGRRRQTTRHARRCVW